MQDVRPAWPGGPSIPEDPIKGGGGETSEGPPTCVVQLQYRSVYTDSGIPVPFFTHAYFSVKDRKGDWSIIEAGPLRVGTVEYLQPYPYPGFGKGFTSSGADPIAWSKSNTEICDSVDKMKAAADTFPPQTIRYYPWDGPNSNSFARYIGSFLGEPLPRPPGARAWETPIVIPGRDKKRP